MGHPAPKIARRSKSPPCRKKRDKGGAPRTSRGRLSLHEFLSREDDWGFEVVGTTRGGAGPDDRGANGAGFVDLGHVEDPAEGRGGGVDRAEPGAAGIFAEVLAAEYCVEGAAAGSDDLYCGA